MTESLGKADGRIVLSVIIVQHNGFELTGRAIDTLMDLDERGVEVILVDNASSGFDAAAWRKRWPALVVIENPKNDGFGVANNLGARTANGEIFLFLNSDTECHHQFVPGVMHAFQSDPHLGILGPKLLYPDGSFQLSAGKLPSIVQEACDKGIARVERHPSVRRILNRCFAGRRPVGWVTGAALFIRRDLFIAVGGFDEEMFMFFEDADLCARVRAQDKEVIFDPSITITHVKGGSSGGNRSAAVGAAYRASQRRYYAKHRPRWEQSVLDVYLKAKGV